ncbi:hypothetical protein LX36DRAFT_742167, partial [Colletotrichum falcatum]
LLPQPFCLPCWAPFPPLNLFFSLPLVSLCLTMNTPQEDYTLGHRLLALQQRLEEQATQHAAFQEEVAQKAIQQANFQAQQAEFQRQILHLLQGPKSAAEGRDPLVRSATLSDTAARPEPSGGPAGSHSSSSGEENKGGNRRPRRQQLPSLSTFDGKKESFQT